MSALDHASLLEQLIITGELVIQMRSTRDPDTVAILLDKVSDEYARPIDGPRVVNMDTMIFATALGAATEKLWSHDRAGATRYLQVIGLLLPYIRDALSLAIELRKRPTA